MSKAFAHLDALVRSSDAFQQHAVELHAKLETVVGGRLSCDAFHSWWKQTLWGVVASQDESAVPDLKTGKGP